ncbi:oxygen-independent coproporphyrinogen III oxidase [Litoreibacter roseus]|nr:oxygen-independent coproporphyrinogen III oxidase [Litoreibacter roseus]
MDTLTHLRKLGLFSARVPRYTSYPTAPVFSTATGASFQTKCMERLDPSEPVSVYVHIPFCERLCWFCACRTQGTTSLAPVERYVDASIAELDLWRDALPEDLRMGRLHWGGGTPTIMTPAMIHKLGAALRAALPAAAPFEFSVEIDPTAVDAAKIAALTAEGMTRASIGIQDFAPEVQGAIGREQSFEATQRCVDMLRDAGITSLNTDLVYGLPHQTEERLAETIEQVLALNADRIALFGYAHVPTMAKRQTLVDETALPDDEARFHLANFAALRLRKVGFEQIGIDHFARPDDSLSVAKRAKKLKRNFQGYTDDTCPTLLGLGASSISRFRQGYVQNASATAAYLKRIDAGQLAGHRGHFHTAEDRLRGRAIEMLMCEFHIDLDILEEEFGAMVSILGPIHDAVLRKFPGLVSLREPVLAIAPQGRPLVRMIAHCYDAYTPYGVNYSKAS